MNRNLGYLLPEFPGQTHIFWWREMNALTNMGIDIDIISTRRPLSTLMCHTWVQQAQQRTTYLFPPRQNLLGILLELLRCGIPGWLRCLQAIFSAKNISFSGRLRLLALAFVGAELSNLARSRNWQHLHVHSCADAAHIAMFAALLSKLSYSLTLHGPLKDYGCNQEQKWRHAAFGIVITQQLYEEVQKTLVGYLPKTIKIAPMGVDLDVFTRTSPYSPWRGQGTCRIFSCGRLNFCKGYVDLIAAIDILRKQGIKTELKIAGEDEQGGNGYRKELETRIQTLGLADSVSLLGAVSEDRVKTGLEDAHIFALASLREPLGVAIMEAMAMELPIVVTGSGGVKELVEEGVNGLLVEPQSPIQLADAMSRLLHNPELSIRLGQAAREKVIQQFQAKGSAKVLYDAITELYPPTVDAISRQF